MTMEFVLSLGLGVGLAAACGIRVFLPVLVMGLAAVAGGGTAGLVRAGTALVRGATNTMTAGLGTPVVSTGENTAAIGLSVLTLVAPLLALAVVLLVVGGIGAAVWRRATRSPARAVSSVAR